MFSKWNLNRNPFFTRAIDKDNINDFAGRTKEVSEIKKYLRLQEGVVAIIAEPGVGSTSICNYCRHTHPSSYTTIHELKIEKIEDGKDMLRTLVIGLIADIKMNNFKSPTANPLIEKIKVSYNIKAPGIGGVNIKKSKNQLPDNTIELTEMFKDLISDILKASKKKFIIFQVNNINIHSPEATKRIHTILEQMRDTFQTRNTFWFIIGDRVLEKLTKNKIPRLNSIIVDWININPITQKDFKEIYYKRITNSGQNAKSPFTSEAIDQLCTAAYGRIRLAFTIASKLVLNYADEILPEIIDTLPIKLTAKNYIEKELWKDFTPQTKTILKFIIQNPGSTLKEIASKLDILITNLARPLNPLIASRLVEKRLIGRTVKHYPIGIAEVISIKDIK